MLTGEKLKQIRKELNLKQAEFARELSISEVSLRNYEKNKHNINIEVIEILKRKFNINCNWLIGDEGDIFNNERNLPVTSVDYQVPMYSIKPSAGSGNLINFSNIVDYFSFKLEWLKNRFNVSPKDIFLLEVDGDSMEPTINNKDIILVDTRNLNSIKEGIYVIRDEDNLMVKRISKIGNTLNIISDNKFYDNISINLNDTSLNFSIIGRVIWFTRKL